jgi:hypothetical protein
MGSDIPFPGSDVVPPAVSSIGIANEALAFNPQYRQADLRNHPTLGTGRPRVRLGLHWVLIIARGQSWRPAPLPPVPKAAGPQGCRSSLKLTGTGTMVQEVL